VTSLNPHTVQRLAAAATAPQALRSLRQGCAWLVGSEKVKGFYALSMGYGLDTIEGTQLPGGTTR
jgi:hypothetical protein